MVVLQVGTQGRKTPEAFVLPAARTAVRQVQRGHAAQYLPGREGDAHAAQQRCQNEDGNLLDLLMVDAERLRQTVRRRSGPASGGVQLSHMTEHRGHIQPLFAFHHSPF